jgi:glycosyltransferase involved in cell wall biosynthesis
MHLVLVSSHVRPGDGQARVNYELALHALERGLPTSVVATSVANDLVERGAQWIRIEPLTSRVHAAAVWEFAQRADRAVARRAGNGTVVHANGYVLTARHCVNTSHFVHGAPTTARARARGVRPSDLHRRLYTKLNARWERQAYSQASVVVAVSEQVAGELRTVGVAADRIQVIPNGVDTREFHIGAVDRLRLGLPEEVPLLLFVGEIRTPRKNLEGVLHALVKTPGVHLAVVGDPRRSIHPGLAIALGLADRVHFLGYRRDIPELMRAATAFVLPSRYEPFSLAVLEALASGLPVITARTVGASELIPPGAGIVLDDPDDTERLAQAIKLLVEDDALRQEMRRRSREIAERHTWDRMAEAYFDLYRAHAG